jgi:hypothetical protein
MWYRIELHSDGSVASCEEAASSLADGRSVHFVEADTKEDAIAILLSSAWQSGARLSSIHRELKKHRRRLGMRPLPLKGKAVSSVLAKTSPLPAPALVRVKREAKPKTKRKSGVNPYNVVKARLYQEVLEKYEQLTAERFRAWLRSKTGEFSVAVRL